MSTHRTLPAVPASAAQQAKPRTETEEKLWQALRNQPGSTATALSAAAGIGRSTAPKMLTRWEKAGLVTRTAGIADGGSRPADSWTVVTDEPIAEPEPEAQPTDKQPIDQHESDEPAHSQQGKSRRLAPGALRGMVEDYLRDNSGEFSPNAIGKTLKRSSGAVHNALEKLVESGYVMRTSDKPKKYSLATVTTPTE